MGQATKKCVKLHTECKSTLGLCKNWIIHTNYTKCVKLHTECKCCLTLDVCKMIYTLYKPYTKVCKVTHVGQITHFVQDYTLCCIAYKVVLNRKCKIITHYYIFCIHSGKIYTGQKKFTQAPPVVPVTNMRYGQDFNLKNMKTITHSPTWIQ